MQRSKVTGSRAGQGRPARLARRASPRLHEGLARATRRALQLGEAGHEVGSQLLRAGINTASGMTEWELAEVLGRVNEAQLVGTSIDERAPLRLYLPHDEEQCRAKALEQELISLGLHTFRPSTLFAVAVQSLELLSDDAFVAALRNASVARGQPRADSPHALVRYLSPEERRRLDELKAIHGGRAGALDAGLAALFALSDAELVEGAVALQPLQRKTAVRLGGLRPSVAVTRQLDEVLRRLRQQLITADESTPWRIAIGAASSTVI